MKKICTLMVMAFLIVCLISPAYGQSKSKSSSSSSSTPSSSKSSSQSGSQSNYSVDRSVGTVNVPYQPAQQPKRTEPVIREPDKADSTKTIMLQTWPVSVPARVPQNTPEKPEMPHALENAGAAEGLGSGR